MDSKTKIIVGIVVVVAVIAVVAVALSVGGDDDETPGTTTVDEPVDATVWIRGDDGEYVGYEGAGTTVEEVLEDALGDDVAFASNGNVESYGGVANGDDGTWVMFRWESPDGWVIVQGTNSVIDGVQLALEYSQVTEEEGVTSYSAPDKEIEMEVYFFIQFKELAEIGSMTNTTVQEMYQSLRGWTDLMGLDDDTLIQGFWIKGTGSTNNEALADAVMGLINETHPELVDVVGSGTESTSDGAATTIVHTVDDETMFSYSTTSTMYGWFFSFLGWSDYQSSATTYIYWSQYSYNPSAESLDDSDYWDYNNLSFGLYDITEYKYFALILQTTEDDGGYENVEIPTPSTIPEGLRPGVSRSGLSGSSWRCRRSSA